MAGIVAGSLPFLLVSGGMRLLLLVAGATAAVVLFVVFRDADDETPPPPPPPPPVVSTIRQPPPPPPKLGPVVVRVNANSSSVTRATIPRGRQVVLVVTGPEDEEVHLHGYDVRRNISPNGTVRLPFRATIPGRFEVELEAGHRQIADLTVR
jgi:hypothetical protein